jgi:hypothetical protein
VAQGPDFSGLAQQIQQANSVEDLARAESELIALKTSPAQVPEELGRLRAQLAVNHELANHFFDEVKLLLEKARTLLPEKVFARLSSKMSVLAIAKVQQSYTDVEKKFSSQANAAQLVESNVQRLVAHIQQKKQAILDQKQKEAAEKIQAQFVELGRRVAQAVLMMESNKKTLDLYRKRLACVDKLKQAYTHYRATALVEQMTNACQEIRQDSIAMLTSLEMEVVWGRVEQDAAVIKSLQFDQSEARSNLVALEDQIDSLLEHLNANLDADGGGKASSWQEKLNHMLMNADDTKLKESLAKFTRIAVIPNPYLRAIIIMRFSQISSKLSLQMINTMVEWRGPELNPAAVKTTLDYLGLKLSPQSFARICPPKKISIISFNFSEALSSSLRRLKEIYERFIRR